MYVGATSVLIKVIYERHRCHCQLLVSLLLLASTNELYDLQTVIFTGVVSSISFYSFVLTDYSYHQGYL